MGNIATLEAEGFLTEHPRAPVAQGSGFCSEFDFSIACPYDPNRSLEG